MAAYKMVIDVPEKVMEAGDNSLKINVLYESKQKTELKHLK